MLAVSDTGYGIDSESMDQIFEPFFTTKGVGEGTGLGLATVYGIVEQNSGFIHVYSEPGKGASFRIYLPRHDVAAMAGQAIPAVEAQPGCGEMILLVEDEPALLDATRLILEQVGYVVFAASSPRVALQFAEEHKAQIDLLLTDVVMPEMNGRELAQCITTLDPDLKCLYMSGYTANVLAHRDVIGADIQFIQKPFSINSLAAKIRSRIGSRIGRKLAPMMESLLADAAGRASRYLESLQTRRVAPDAAALEALKDFFTPLQRSTTGTGPGPCRTRRLRLASHGRQCRRQVFWFCDRRGAAGRARCQFSGRGVGPKYRIGDCLASWHRP